MWLAPREIKDNGPWIKQQGICPLSPFYLPLSPSISLSKTYPFHKTPPFGLQKVAFQALICHLSEAERAPFGA